MYIVVEIKGFIDLCNTIISLCFNGLCVFSFCTSETVVVSSEGLSPQAKVSCKKGERSKRTLDT